MKLRKVIREFNPPLKKKRVGYKILYRYAGVIYTKCLDNVFTGKEYVHGRIYPFVDSDVSYPSGFSIFVSREDAVNIFKENGYDKNEAFFIAEVEYTDIVAEGYGKDDVRIDIAREVKNMKILSTN